MSTYSFLCLSICLFVCLYISVSFFRSLYFGRKTKLIQIHWRPLLEGFIPAFELLNSFRIWTNLIKAENTKIYSTGSLAKTYSSNAFDWWSFVGPEYECSKKRKKLMGCKEPNVVVGRDGSNNCATSDAKLDAGWSSCPRLKWAIWASPGSKHCKVLTLKT